MKNISIGGICSIFSVLFLSVDCETSDADKSGFIAGDYIIGALFPIHAVYEYVNNSRDVKYIKYIDDYDGIQIAEAAFFAVDLINKNENILPNITLGIDIRDYKEEYSEALQQTFNLLNYATDEKVPNFKDLFSSIQNNSKPPLLGIIGPASFPNMAQVQSYLSAFPIIQIAYSGASAHVHENHWSYSFEPGYQHLTEAIVDILMIYNWTYVSLIYSSSNEWLSEISFWDAGRKHFERLAGENGICIDSIINENELILKYREESYNFERALENVNVIVCYCSFVTKVLLYNLLEQWRLYGTPKKFVVITIDYELARGSYSSPRLQSSVEGEILLRPKPTYIKEFDDYFLSRNLLNNKRNPWFVEFWEYYIECKFKQDVKNWTICSDDKILRWKHHKQNPKVARVMKAVFLLAHGLHNYFHRSCRFEKLPLRFLDKHCYAYNTKRAEFDFNGQRFSFQTMYSLPIEYDILNFQHLENGSYDYVKIGEFGTSDNPLELSEKNYSYDFIKNGEYAVEYMQAVWEDDSQSYSRELYKQLLYMGKRTYLQNVTLVRSTIGEPCSTTQMKVMKDKCRWDCVTCGPLEFLRNFTCHGCFYGFMSNLNKTDCSPIPMERIEWHDVRTIVLFVGSALNIILTVFTTCIFIKYRHTPVVKASTVELCYIMLTGNLAANLTTFVVIPVPSIVSCALVRTLPPFSFAFIYAALVVKTNRIAETLAISKKKFPKFKSRFQPKAMVAITLILISIQVFPCLQSLYKYPIEPENNFRQRTASSFYGFRICPLNENILMELFSYVCVLKLFCTYYAIKTRNVAENYNEAKFIGFAMYANILTNIAFGWVLSHVGDEIKVISMTLCILVNSLVLWSLLFAPKLYVILWVPEKNTREHFKTTADIRCFIGGQHEEKKCIADGIQKPKP